MKHYFSALDTKFSPPSKGTGEKSENFCIYFFNLNRDQTETKLLWHFRHIGLTWKFRNPVTVFRWVLILIRLLKDVVKKKTFFFTCKSYFFWIATTISSTNFCKSTIAPASSPTIFNDPIILIQISVMTIAEKKQKTTKTKYKINK